MLGTIRRAGLVLDLFTVETPEWGATAVAAELGVSKSQAHELLSSLAAIGVLQHLRRGRYQLGWRTLALSSALTTSSGLKAEAGNVMRAMVSCYGETVHLAVWDRDGVVFVDRRGGANSLKLEASAVGARLPGHCGGVGKVLSAYRDSEEADAAWSEVGLEQFTANTIVDRDRLHAELQSIRTRGFGVDNEEVVESVCCVGAPIIDSRGDVVAALSISVPAQRWAKRRGSYAGAIRKAATQVSHGLRRAECAPSTDCGGAAEGNAQRLPDAVLARA